MASVTITPHYSYLKPINITSSCIDRPLIKRLEYKSMLLDKNGFFIENELLAKQWVTANIQCWIHWIPFVTVYFDHW